TAKMNIAASRKPAIYRWVSSGMGPASTHQAPRVTTRSTATITARTAPTNSSTSFIVCWRAVSSRAKKTMGQIHGKIPRMEAPITLRVNGAVCEVDGEALLIEALRDGLGLKGTRFGCGTEQCGACMVLVDGSPSCSCAVPAGAFAGKSVTTIE